MPASYQIRALVSVNLSKHPFKSLLAELVSAKNEYNGYPNVLIVFAVGNEPLNLVFSHFLLVCLLISWNHDDIDKNSLES